MKYFVFLLLISPHAYSQVELESIEVTTVRSNKDGRSFIETNESISVLNESQLNRSDLSNSVQMLNGLSNIQTQTDKNGETFSIRGISDMGVTGYQKDNLATILVDDVFQTQLALRAGSFENWDLESIEVRRGAQSTDQGVNSLAGNILLYHKEAHQFNEGAAKLALGNFGRKEAGVTWNKALTNKLFWRASYNKEVTDGFITNTSSDNDKWGGRNKDHFSTNLVYQFNKTDFLKLDLKAMRKRQGGGYSQNTDYEVNENVDFRDVVENQQLALTLYNNLSSGWTNKMILAASKARGTVTSDEDGTVSNVAGTRTRNEVDDYVSFENQLRYTSKNYSNLLGVHLHRYHLDNFHNFNLMLSANLTMKTTQEDIKNRQTLAIFDTFIYDFNKHHSLLLGARLENVSNEMGTGVNASAAPYSALNGTYIKTQTTNSFLPKIAYTFKFDSYAMGATYSQGYRTGGVAVNRLKGQANEYGAEKTHNYELSFKSQKKDQLVSTNFFYTKWNDQQVEVIYSNQFDSSVENASSSEIYGAEFEFLKKLTASDKIRVNLGYVHTQFLNFKTSTKDFTSNHFPDASPFNGQLSYWRTLSERWSLILVSRYLASAYTNADNDRHSPSQFYQDVNLQYTKDQYIVELYLRNLFDQQYRIFNGKPRSTGPTYQANYHRMSSPREFGARLNYYF